MDFADESGNDCTRSPAGSACSAGPAGEENSSLERSSASLNAAAGLRSISSLGAGRR